MRFLVLMIQFPFGGFLNHGGNPKSSIFMGLSILNHPKKWGTTMAMETSDLLMIHESSTYETIFLCHFS